MCDKVAPVAGNLMKGIEPELKVLLPFIGVSGDSETTVFAAYDKAEALLINWVDGTESTEVIEALDDFDTVFDAAVKAAGLPAIMQILADTITATISVIVGLVTKNSPPQPTTTAPSAEAVQAEVEEEVKTLVPDFKRSLLHSPAYQQKRYWNKKVGELTAVDGKYATLKV